MRVISLVLASLLAVSAQAQDSASNPDDEIARGLFQAGKAGFDAGRYQDAYDNWYRAYEHSGRPQLLYNLGLASDRLRHDREALDYYRAYLSEFPNAENRGEVQNRIQALRAAVRKEEEPAPVDEPAPVAQMDLGAESASDERDGSVFTEWWFWTVAGAIVAAVVVGVAVSTGGDEVTVAQPNSGVTLQALSW